MRGSSSLSFLSESVSTSTSILTVSIFLLMVLLANDKLGAEVAHCRPWSGSWERIGSLIMLWGDPSHFPVHKTGFDVVHKVLLWTCHNGVNWAFWGAVDLGRATPNNSGWQLGCRGTMSMVIFVEGPLWDPLLNFGLLTLLYELVVAVFDGWEVPEYLPLISPWL